MLITRQVIVTDAAWYRLKATGYPRKVRVKENPEAAGWPTAKWRFGGGTPQHNAEPSEPTGTAYVSLTAGSEKVFDAPDNAHTYRPDETIAFLRLASGGSTTLDISEEPAS